MLSDSTGLITTIFKCPSMKPCGAALIDAVPASIRKMQAAAMDLGTDDIRTKDQADSFHYPGRFSTVKRAAPMAALFARSRGSSGYGPPRGSFHMPCECVAA